MIKEDFIKYIEERVDFSDASDELKDFWNVLKGQSTKETKVEITDNGKMILKFLQDNPNIPLWKSRDVAEALFVSSRTVSGSMRKLCDDGYVEKIGKDPIIYSITEKGKKYIID